MTGDQVIHELFAALDTMDVERVTGLMSDDVQGVDEVRRVWLRGKPAVTKYLAGVARSVDHVTAQISDISVTDGDEARAVTFVLDLVYNAGGREQSAHAPTSALLRREQDSWKIALYHSVTLRARTSS
jgi:uncharacterized protein (TIGR02246 family)